MTATAQALARNWVGWYTGWVGAEAAERRRAEIESDLWDQLADARDRAVPPSKVALSITRRVVAGIPADLLWIHTQRLAARGRPAERKARLMNTLGRFIAAWWWTAAAAVLATIYSWIGVGNLLMPGMPYLDGTIQAFTLTGLLVAGVALQKAAPRLAGGLAIAGALSGVLVTWSPVTQVAAAAVSVGAVLLALRHTGDVMARVRTGIALAVVGLAPLAFVLFGSLQPVTLPQVLALAAGLAGLALLVASGRTREVATA